MLPEWNDQRRGVHSTGTSRWCFVFARFVICTEGLTWLNLL